MMNASVQKTALRLRDLLIKERDLLRDGYPVESISLVKEKTELMLHLGPLIDSWERGIVADPEIQLLEEIKSLATENSARFNAIKNGLKSLIERFTESSAVTQIGAYDQAGKPLQFQRATGSYKVSV